MFNSGPVLTAVLTGGYWLLTLIVIVRILSKRRTVSGTLAWLLLIAALPVAGLVAYLMMGELTLGRRRERLTEAMSRYYLGDSKAGTRSEHGLPGGERALAVHRMLQNRTGICAHSYQTIELLDTPQAIFQRLLDDLNAARFSIRMEFYIWHPGKRVDEVMHALIKARQRGVSVEIIVDHAGSRPYFRSEAYKQMVDAGISVVPALPAHLWRFLFRRLDLRLHRKLIVIDHGIAYTGSMNMADPDCFNYGRGYGKWVDIMLRIEGQAASALSRVISWDWEVETEERLSMVSNTDIPRGTEWLSVLPSGPGVGEDLIEQAVLATVYRANEHIQICTPYFVPSEELYEALCHAARRQVRIDLIIPKKNNSWLIKWASQSYFDTLLRLGVRIYLFEDGLLHAKVLMVDDELAFVGSVNLDVRSLQLNFELSVVLFTPNSCALINQRLAGYRERAKRLDPGQWAVRPHRHRVLERILFFMSPLL